MSYTQIIARIIATVLSILLLVSGGTISTRVHAQSTQTSSTTTTQSTTTPSETVNQSIYKANQEIAQQKQGLLDAARYFIFAAYPEYPTNQSLDKLPVYPSTSINQAVLEQIFGPSGLAIDSQLLSYIYAFYFYFDYTTRREKAAKLLTQAIAQNIDYTTVLTQSGWQGLITQLAPSGTFNYDQITTITQEAWLALSQSLIVTFNAEKLAIDNYWQNITQSSFWTAITITQDDLQNSLFWQDFLKVMITKSFTLDNHLLTARQQNEQQLFRYIPYLETSYYLPDFTQQRYTGELVQLSLGLNEQARLRLLAQSNDWGKLTLVKKGKQSGYDFAKILKAAQSFSTESFYKTVETISNVGSKGPNSPFVQEPNGTIAFKHITLPEPYKHELLFFGMALTLQTLTQQLFNQANLTKTMTALATATTAPAPWVFAYQTDDYVYLNDFNILQAELAALAKASVTQTSSKTGSPSRAGSSSKSGTTSTNTNSISSASSSDNPTGTTQSFVSWVENWGDQIWNEIKQTGEDAWATAKDLWNVVKDESEVFYYQSGLATLIQHMPPAQAEQTAQTYKAAITGDFQQFGADVKGLVSNIEELVTAPFTAPIAMILQGIGAILNDPSLASDYEQMLSYVADAFGDVFAGAVELTESAFNLTTDAVTLLANTIVIISTGGQVGTELWVDNWKLLGYDIVTSILDTITITLGTLKDTIEDLIKAVGYIIKLLTDSIIDLGSALAAVVNPEVWLSGGPSLSDYYAQVHEELEQHSMLISNIVTVGLLIGSVIATGGTDIGMVLGVGANLAFGSLMIIGGAQQDAQISNIEQEIKTYLDNFTVWTANQVIITEAMQQSLLTEVQQQLSSEVINRQLSVGFYENFYNQLVNQFVSQTAYSLGAYQANLVFGNNPNTDVIMGDMGSIYGYHTNWLNLNPSQGLGLYSPARGHFAQEIAQLPATFSTTNKSGQTVQEPYFWFLQNSTQDHHITPTTPITFEIRFKPIYLLDSYYIGISIGGKPLDKNKIIKEQKGNVDRYHLAKMAVLTNKGAHGASDLAVYEHETKLSKDGWLSKNNPAPDLIPGQWYHLRATLTNNTLQTQVWQEGSTPSSSITTTVTPLLSGISKSAQAKTIPAPLSVIFSGASIEYDIISPKGTHYPHKSYTSTQGPALTELAREKQARTLYTTLKTPLFGSWKLRAFSLFDLLKGYYVYNTVSEVMTTTTNAKITNDYVTFATFDTTASPQVATNINTAPTTNMSTTTSGTGQSALVSLVNGLIYDQTGAPIGYQQNIGNTYQELNIPANPLSTHLNHTLTSAQKSFAAALSYAQTSIPFGQFTLSLASSDDAANGFYIYKTTINNLTHYIILATTGTIFQYGMPYISSYPNLTNFISLVSGQMYTNSGTAPLFDLSNSTLITSAYNPKNFTKKLQSQITAAKAAYQKASPQTASTQGSDSTGGSGSIVAPSGSGPNATIPSIGGSQESLNQQQQSASTGGGWGGSSNGWGS